MNDKESTSLSTMFYFEEYIVHGDEDEKSISMLYFVPYGHDDEEIPIFDDDDEKPIYI